MTPAVNLLRKRLLCLALSVNSSSLRIFHDELRSNAGIVSDPKSPRCLLAYMVSEHVPAPLYRLPSACLLEVQDMSILHLSVSDSR
ncbi:hypothetical protein BJY00DRAFT_77029 [Aspergillus carlsbadensis]|nr:hypothetical protein BJY00DRAFT_77029 [Aspergillus carlsbadensis]